MSIATSMETVADKTSPTKPIRAAQRPSSDTVLDHYFKRLDPQVVASFTTEQRDAIKTLLGLRRMAKHSVEIRRSVPFGRRRFYLVFLLGREKRSLVRLYGEGAMSWSFTALVYLGLAVFGLAAMVGLAKLLGLM